MKINDSRIQNILNKKNYIQNGRIHCLGGRTESIVHEEMNDGINRVKLLLKRHARTYEFLRAFFSPGISVTPHLTPLGSIYKAFKKNEVAEKIMINIGAGVKPIHDEIINVDVFPYEGIHIVAEGSNLPFLDASINLVICESVIEHVLEPELVFKEIARVLAPGGYAYVSLPFMYPFHASPNDFTRFTRNALRQRFSGFEVIDEGMRAGPMTALQGLLMHLFAIIFSLGNYKLYLLMSQLFMIVLSPLKLLDLIFCVFPYSHEIAADIYIFIRKPEKTSSY
jgi:SAM-dependent methyltransferase